MTLSYGEQKGTPYRVQVINGEPLFVARDLCEVLGISKYRDFLSNLDDDELVSMIVDTKAGKRTMTGVNESGFYHLIFLSRKQEAAAFRRHVTMEVLPSIRRTGSFSLDKSRRILPRDRSREMGEFYGELSGWVTRSNEMNIAKMMNVTVKHVHAVAVGRRPSYGVCCMLVEAAKENRRNGVRRVDSSASTRHRQMEELRLEFMEE